jgi:hypothetical protein
MGEIERKIRHVKNRSRSTKVSLPYKALPKCVIKSMLSNVLMWMNAVRNKQGISTEFSPREIVLRRALDVSLHAQWPFGAYGEAYDDPTPNHTNTMQERTKSCINLGPTGNFQGTHKFLNLETGEVIKRMRFTEIPMPDSAIARVEYWAKRDKQERSDTLVFSNRNNEHFGWDEEGDNLPLVDDNAVEQEPTHAAYPDIPAELPGIELECNMPTTAIAPDTPPDENEIACGARDNANINPNIIPPEDGRNDRSGHGNRHGNSITNNFVINHYDGDGEQVPALMRRDDSSDDEDDDDDDEDYVPSDEEDIPLVEDAVEDDKDHRSARDHRSGGARSGGRPARERRLPQRFEQYQMFQSRRDFRRADEVEAEMMKNAELQEKLVGIEGDAIELEPGEELIFGHIMLQLCLKQGLKKWGKRGEASAMKEMQQLHDWKHSSRVTRIR